MYLKILDILFILTGTFYEKIVGLFYNYINKIVTKENITFLNYGLAHLDKEYKSTNNSDFFCSLLYKYLLDRAKIKDKKTLDVGCGLGGGALLLKKNYYAEEVYGIDISSRNIQFCQRKYNDIAGMRFFKASASDIPFQDNFFDIVTNVESSHNYSNILRYYKEVHRVLRPSGVFLYTDFFMFSDISKVKKKI